MILKTTVTSKRRKLNPITGMADKHSPLEDYTEADVEVSGNRRLIVATLRSLADALDKDVSA